MLICDVLPGEARAAVEQGGEYPVRPGGGHPRLPHAGRPGGPPDSGQPHATEVPEVPWGLRVQV